MSCQIQTSKHLEFVKRLVKYDAALYFNFDNAATFILESDLTPELKKISLHNVALIYKTLDSKQPDTWKLGKVDDVLTSEHLIDDTKLYMSVVSKMFSTKIPGVVTIEAVNKAIEALSKKSVIVESDLIGPSGVISMFNNFMASHTMTDDQITDAKTQFKNSTTQAINQVLEGSAAQFMIDLLNARMDVKKGATPYVPMSEVAELAKLNPVIITLNNKQIVEGVVEDDVVKRANPDGTFTELSARDYISYGPISYQSEGTSVELVLGNQSVKSNLIIKAADPSKQQQVVDAIMKSANLRSDVEIFAISLETADARLQQIKNNASPEVAANRNHETFENASQIEYLSSTPGAAVISVARPNKQDTMFSLVGVIKSTGEIFNIYSFDNYVVVDSNNNTRTVNLTDAADKELFKSKVLKSTNEGAVGLNNLDIANIISSNRAHQMFKASIYGEIAEDLKNEGSVNITTEFFDTYSFKVQKDREDVKLDKILDKDKTLSLPLPIATFDDAGNVISTESRNIPFVYALDTSDKTNATYSINSFLAANEKIVVTIDGKDQYVSEETYVRDVLEIPDIDAHIKNNIIKNLDNINSRIALRFKDGQPFSYAPINTEKAFQDLGNFSIMFDELSEILKEKDSSKRKEKLTAFSKQYRFAGGKGLFYIDFVNTADGKTIQLRLKPSTSPQASVYYDMMMSKKESEKGDALKGVFYFPFAEKDIKLLNEVANSMNLSSATHKAIIAEIPSLAAYDVTTVDGKADFITALSELADEGSVGPKGLDFMYAMSSSRSLFSKFLVSHVVDTLEERTKAIPGFMTQLKNDFSWKGKVELERLLVYNRDGIDIPYMNFSRVNAKGVNRFYKNMKYWTVVKTSFPYVNVRNQATPVVEADTQELLEKGMDPAVVTTASAVTAPVVPPVIDENLPTDTTPNQSNNDIINSDDYEAGFKLETPIDILDIIPDEQVKLQIAEIRKILPQFEIDETSLKDVLKLMNVDGTVLGMYKDRVIYLNDVLKVNGIVYHEAFHGVFRSLLDNTYRRELLNKVISNPIHSSKFTESNLQEFARKRGMVYNREKMIDLVAEEVLADGFQNHMLNKKKAPKGIIGQFFEMLRKLLEFFTKNKTDIEYLYGKISDGYYADAIIKSELYKNESAFELIPTVNQLFTNKIGQTVERPRVLGSKDQTQLVNFVVREMITMTTDGPVTFDAKFDLATKKILDEIYNVDKLVAANPENEALIRESLAARFNDLRFVLGARMLETNTTPDSQKLFDKNDTGDASFANRVTAIRTSEGKDNTLGQESKAVLKKLVQTRLKELIISSSEEDADSISINKVEDFLNTTTGTDVTDDPNDEDEVSTDDFEKGFNEISRIEGIPAEFRKFISTMRRDIYDEDLGIYIPNMVDATGIFHQLLKVTSNKYANEIIPHLEYILKQNKEDYSKNEFSNDLEAVINEIKKLAASNSQLYNLIINVLHGTELDLIFMRLSTPQAVEEGDEISTEDIRANGQEARVRIFEQIEAADANKTRNSLITSMLFNNSTKSKSEEQLKKYNEALLKIKKISEQIGNSLAANNSILEGLNPNKLLNDNVNELHDALAVIGLNLPKSLIKMSLLAIDKFENGKNLDRISEENKLAFDNNQDLIAERKYLESGFFSALVQLSKVGLAGQSFKGLIDDTSEKKIAYVDTFNNVLRRASTYINKYDPSAIPSVVKNAENKPIYRYVKYTPLLSMALDVRKKGIKEAIKQDDEKVFNDFLNEYFKEHPMLDDFFNGNDGKTDKAKIVQILLSNMRIAMTGGAQQVIGGIYKDGKTFKGMDPKSVLLMNLFMFMNRNTQTGEVLSNGETSSIQIFLRNFGQLESSGTNFMMPAMYNEYVTKSSLKSANYKIKKEGAHYTASRELIKILRHEYENIRKEWHSQDKRKEAYQNGDNQYVNGYNSVKASNGEIITNDRSLRAYKFSKLEGALDLDPDFKNDLISLAIDENIPFDNLTPTNYGDILGLLDLYIDQQIEEHFAIYQKFGVIKKATAEINAVPGTVNTAGMTDAQIAELRKPETRNFYTSDFIPSQIVNNGYQKSYINDIYGSPTKLYGKNDTLVQVSPGANTVNIEALLVDFILNDLINGLHFKDIFVGNASLGISNAQEELKREKKNLATGDNNKEKGFHKISVVEGFKVFIHDKYRTKGPYTSLEEIEQDKEYELSKPNTDIDKIEQIYKELAEGFAAAYDKTNPENSKYRKMLSPIFDGQSYALLMHQMDSYETGGRLNEAAKELLIAAHYRELTPSEILKLEKLKIVNNSHKTVTASRVDYIKMSEGVIMRHSVSKLKDSIIQARLASMPEGSTVEDAIDSINETLHDNWSMVYSLRKELQDLSETDSIYSDAAKAIEEEIRSIISEIHNYYRPIGSRVMLHNLLNSMEYHQVDHFMDVEASKTMTYLPSTVGNNAAQQSANMVNGYLPINVSSRWVSNKYKYNQVETSGVSDTAKFSVQSKVLAPADVNNLAEIITNIQKRELNDYEKSQLNSITKRLLQDYETSLKDSTNSRLLYLTNILREGGDFKIDKVYDLIRENLSAQGATPSLLEMFSVVNGKPKYSPNLPQLRKVLEYYFFSQYSKNVNDEKGSGGKYIHISSLGYNVYEDINTGKVITTEEYEANPDAYDVRIRPLSVESEVTLDEDGNEITTYYAEVMLPKPLVNNPEFLEFYQNYLTKLYATRIPTEDKRSMIVLKVVDYLDSSNMNGIVVPHFIHLLAGSDFDIDTLYAHAKSYYTDMAGMYNMYGNYDNYPTDEDGKFAEFVHFMARSKDFSKLIKSRERELLADGSFDLTSDTADMLTILGYTSEEYDAVMNVAELSDTYDELTDEINRLSELKDLKKEELEDYIQKQVIHKTPTKKKKSVLKSFQELADQEQVARAREISSIGRSRQVLIEQRRELRKELRENKAAAKALKNSALKVQATFDVMRKYNLPTTRSAFEANSKYSKMVLDKYQNDFLDAKIKLIGNSWVFDNLYIKETASTQLFEDIASKFGLSLGDSLTKLNSRTSAFAAISKEEVSIYKDAIGKAANLNKFLSMASWYGLELASPIWNFSNGLENENKLYSKFGGITDDNLRAIAVIGNALGMFADGVKKPIPKTLFMNDTNVGITMAMLGVGLKADFAIGFNFIPEIIDSAREVANSKTGISNDVFQNQLYYNNVISSKIFDMVKEDRDVLVELANAGLLDPKRNALGVPLIMDELSIEFNANKLDLQKVAKGEITTSEIGFKVSSKKTKMPLSEKAQKIVLLKLYANQASQSFQLMSAGSIINLLKSLKPSFAAFDRMKSNVEDLFNGKLFTLESLEPMKNDQVWQVLQDMMVDLDDQSKLLFFDRSDFFKPIKNIFDTIFKDKTNIATTVVGYAALKRFREVMPGSRTSRYDEIQNLIDQEDEFIKDVFTAEFWFTNDLGNDLLKFQNKYPNNKFLAMLKEVENDRYVVKVKEKDSETIKRKKMRYITSIGKMEIKGDMASEIVSDAYKLTEDLEAKLFLKKLLYQDYARTALTTAPGSFYHLIPAELRLSVSENIDLFNEVLSSSGAGTGEFNVDEFNVRMAEYLSGVGATDMNKVYDFFSDMFLHLGYAALKEPNNTSIKFAGNLKVGVNADSKFTSAFVKSLKNIGETPTQKDVNTVTLEILRELFDQPAFSKTITKNLNVADFALGNEFTIDLDITHPNATKDTAMIIARAFNIKPSKKQTTTGVYEFPIIIKFNKKAYILQGVNSGIENGTIGENVYKSITEGGGFGITGTRAKYVELPQNMMGDSLSPAAFDVSEAKKFTQLTSRTSKSILDLSDVSEVPVTLKEQIQSMGDVKSQVVQGDIFAIPGIPVITTNLGGIHGAGLAQAAAKKGLIQKGDGGFKATDKVVQLPVKKIWSDNMSMNNNMQLLATSLNKLQEVAENNPKNTYLLPLAGTGHGEGNLAEILPMLVEVVMETPNIKLVIPTDDVSLGRMGTVRQDTTKQNLPMIREVLGLSEPIKPEPITKEVQTPTNNTVIVETSEEEDEFEGGMFSEDDLSNILALQNLNNSSLGQQSPTSASNLQQPGAGTESKLEKDLRELNLTDEVLEYLYNDRIGGQPQSFESYAEEVKRTVEVMMINGTPKEDILNQIKCII